MKHIFTTILLLLSLSAIAQGNLGEANKTMQYNAALDQYAGRTANNGTYYQTGQGGSNAYLRNDSVMEIGSRVLMNVAPEGYIVIFALTQSASTLEKCDGLMNERIEGFKASLKRIGINEEFVKTDIVSQVPTFEFEVEKKLFSKNAVEVPTGFQLKKNVHIYYSKGSQIDKILQAAAANEIYDIVQVEFVIDDVAAVYDTLRQVAAQNILAKKKAYETLGIKVNPRFQVVAESVYSISPDERYKSMTSYVSTPVPSNSKSVDRLPKEVSYYYDRVGYLDYDQYINPREVAPSMQFVMHLVVRYSLKRQ